MANFEKRVKINDRKNVSISSYKGSVWLHFRHIAKAKTLTFSKDDYTSLLNKNAKIMQSIKQCKKHIQKKSKGKKSKKRRCDDSSSEQDLSDIESAVDSNSESE